VLTFKVLAALLVYPEQEVIDSLDEMEAILERERLLPSVERQGIRGLLEYLRSADLMDAQALYVRLFDQSRSLSLHLFEHIHGDSRERGQAMADLIEHYRSKGLEVSAAELPDFLPLFLEFLSLQPLGEARALLGETVDILALLHLRLEQRQAPYAAVLRALAALSPRRPDQAAIREEVAAERPDDTPEALDTSWEDKPVTFGPEPPAGAGVAGCPAAASVVDRFAPPVR
jgi:nitrate reductase molybdenum cofactor assembly chaperone NarJ/NarW